MAEVVLPSGTVTFLFTDLAVSTRLWDTEPDAMRVAMARHDDLLRAAIESHDGHVVKGRGDGVHAVFATADAAVLAAVDCKRAMDAESWPVSESLRVRIGIHTGSAELRDGDYFGSAVNRAARLEAIAHGGQIVCSQATADLARDVLPQGVELVDLGEHRLRDLSRPERVFQVNAPGLATTFPSLSSFGTAPSNLPAQLTSFVGRDAEIGRVHDALADGRLVTLTGTGGVGKTRLAIQVAAEMSATAPDAVWLCELAAADGDEAMLQVVGTALGVTDASDTPLDGRIRSFLRAKHALLVLDNCEHVLDAVCALTEGILRDCAGVRIMATSREPLDVSGEQVIRVRSLSVPGASAAADEVLAAEAVQLFVARAASAENEFVLTSENAGSVAQICRRLDGIPLAIELAAARVASMRPAEIAELLDERFRLLTGGRRTAVERHQTLRAMVDWSYSLLNGSEQLVFDRLAVFPASFDAEAARAVTSGDGVEAWDVVDALAGLVQKSMVARVAVDDATARYELLETMRAYARERLDERGEGDRRRRAHTRYYAELAEQSDRAVVGSSDLRSYYRDRAYDIDNYRAALAWSLDAADPDDALLGLPIAAHFAAVAGGAVRSATIGLVSIDQLLARSESASTSVRGSILAGVAMDALLRHGDLARAVEYADQALTASSGASARSAATMTGPYLVLAWNELGRGRLDTAREVLDRGQRDGSRGDDPPHWDAFWAIMRAHVDLTAGDTTAARRHAVDAVALARNADFPLRLAQALNVLAAATLRDDPTTAQKAVTEACELAGDLAAGAVNQWITAARLSLLAGDREGALGHLQRSGSVAQYEGVFSAISTAAVAVVVLAAFEPTQESAAELAGVVTAGPYAHLLVISTSPEDRRDIEEAARRLRVELGDAAFEGAVARGAALTAESLPEFTARAIDRACTAVMHR
jgi:predicted ATPase/class 3 adenylate cyclase